MHSKTAGSALLMTLLFLGIIGVLAQKLVQSALLTSRMLNEQIHATEAKILAINGLTLACAQLDPQKAPGKKQSAEEFKKQKLTKLLLTLNRWQTFKLTNELDGVEGTLKICICCEEGKIPVNDLVDLKTKTPNKAYFPVLKTFQEIAAKKNTSLIPKLSAYIQKRTVPLEDPTQLNTIFPQKLFYDPTRPRVDKKMSPPPPTLPWLDVFSCWNVTGKLNPLFFSSSLCTVLKLKNPFGKPIDDKDTKDIYPRIAESISKEWGSDWKKNWSILAPLYGAEPQMPAEITSLLSEAVEPSTFSVLSCGIVRGVEQRLYAIVHKKKTSQSTENQQESASGPTPPQSRLKAGHTCLSPENLCGIVRMYWVDTFNYIDNQTVGLSA